MFSTSSKPFRVKFQESFFESDLFNELIEVVHKTIPNCSFTKRTESVVVLDSPTWINPVRFPFEAILSDLIVRAYGINQGFVKIELL